MFKYKKLAVIDHDWSLYQIWGSLKGLYFDGSYAIIHDEDCISSDFWTDLERMYPCVINKHLGIRLKHYYE